MPVLIMVLVAAAALAVLVGVVFIVLGKGGQLARFEADYPPLNLPDDRPVKAHDLGRMMLPLALWGYHVRAVDELLLRLTSTLREREERIQDLEWRLSRLDPSYLPEGTGPRPGSGLPGDAYAPEGWGPDHGSEKVGATTGARSTGATAVQAPTTGTTAPGPAANGTAADRTARRGTKDQKSSADGRTADGSAAGGTRTDATPGSDDAPVDEDDR